MARFSELSVSDAEKAQLAAIVTSFLGDDVVGLQQLERVIQDHLTDPRTLHLAAAAYAMVAGAIESPDLEKANRYTERAVSLLRQAMDAGLEGYAGLQSQRELAAIRDTGPFQAFIAQGVLERRYICLHRTSAEFQALALYDLEPGPHLEACRPLVLDGYRPVTMGAAYMPGEQKVITASVWQRPRISENDQDTLASRQANAALGLLRMGHADIVWPLLRHSPDPSLRTYIFSRFSTTRVSPSTIAERLPVETDLSIQRALILGLGQYTSPSPVLQTAVVPQLLSCYRHMTDPGLHVAAEWVLRRWGREPELAEIERQIPRGVPDDSQRVFLTPLGQKMIVVPGPVQFMMGSPCTAGKIYSNEPLHLRHIPRSYAIGCTEVTVQQFRAFLQDVPSYDHYSNKKYSPTEDCPQGTVTWFDAVAYCRWLSEKEGTPEDQMCYPAIPEIKEGMALPVDYLHRTGYRLPTEAEWEYACRAGSEVNRCYGRSDDVLLHFAWCDINSGDRTWPVGSLLPNDFGLFDVYGNMYEWCQEFYRRYPIGTRGQVVLDGEFPITEVDARVQCIMRGQDSWSSPIDIEAAFRAAARPTTRSFNVGFRLRAVSNAIRRLIDRLPDSQCRAKRVPLSRR